MDDEYDMEDPTESIMQGLREVYAHQRGEIHLPTFDEFAKELESCAHAPRGWPLLAALRAKNKVKRGTGSIR